MFDMDHPQSSHRFAAYHQIALVHKFAYAISLSTGHSRRDFYDIIKPAIIALMWLNEHRFENRKEIHDTIAAVDQELLSLVAKTHHGQYVGELTNCPACDALITEFGSYKPHGVDFTVPEYRYCEPCLERFANLLEKLKSASDGFGLEAI
ncbi:MAG: hypothetical protein C0478_14315 [Planctomyces sp.]|nr:hypothetical protein [Planctomyces sp.]